MTVTPYQQNDYQGISTFRPYQLPVNDIVKSLQAQNQYWMMGASKVKSYYDNALNLKLSIPGNKEVRDNFIQKADKQLTKLSSMDLADPSVQRQGINIYAPLFKDEGVMYDDMSTRHIEKVNGDALMYREKDNGKGYSYYNHKYALMGSQEFMNSKDRMAGKKFMQTAKE